MPALTDLHCEGLGEGFYFETAPESVLLPGSLQSQDQHPQGHPRACRDSFGNPPGLFLAETFPVSFKNFSDSKLNFLSPQTSPGCAGLSSHSKTSFSPPQIRRVSFANPIFQEGLADDIDRRSPVIRSHSSPSSRSLKILSNMQVR